MMNFLPFFICLDFLKRFINLLYPPQYLALFLRFKAILSIIYPLLSIIFFQQVLKSLNSYLFNDE